ncbi:MAG: hypothetical protein JXR77_02905 [Lentisphaeria bacterium]|nr:hypothetical protein [Lentisphaeria bacterium]
MRSCEQIPHGCRSGVLVRALRLAWVAALMAGGMALGQPQGREPHVGYLFPAGGQRGTVVRVVVGGQFLRGVNGAVISGEGVRADVLRTFRPLRNLDREQRELLQRTLNEAREAQLGTLPGKRDLRSVMLPWERPPAKGPAARKTRAEKQAQDKAVELPEHPLLADLDARSLPELQHIVHELFHPALARTRQPNTQIAESVLIEVTIEAMATGGDRELRLRTASGLTNPVCFQVGELPETRELEPNDPGAVSPLPAGPPLTLPALVNGQVMPGDVDRFRFRARAGQALVARVWARRLVPFLADAVPGWFQGVIELRDAEGKELAFADDFRFDPDPVLHCVLPADGVYTIDIRDSIYRGREDFVYRLALGELPLVTTVFPLGARAGSRTTAAIDGWNLPRTRLPLDTEPGGAAVRLASPDAGACCDPILYAVDTLPESLEKEPNDTPGEAERLPRLPLIVNGRIGKAGDVDAYRFRGRKGEVVVAEITARRLRSPVDSLLRLTDGRGQVLALNDDFVRKDGDLHQEVGCLTHYADSYLSATLPRDGMYIVHVSDAQQQGGDAHAYRLRLGPPQPDFSLHLCPSSLSLTAGKVAPVTVHALRRDGFDGPIELLLGDDAPEGFHLAGGRIAPGQDSVRATLTAAPSAEDRLLTLALVGRARIGERTVTRPVTPCDDVMQAFLWRHLVPSQALAVAVRKNAWGLPSVEVVGDLPIRVPAGGEARVTLRTSRRGGARVVELEIREPTAGLAVEDVKSVPGGFAFTLRARKEELPHGHAANAILEAFTRIANRPGGKAGAKDSADKQRTSLGLLPAIPFEIVRAR